MADELQPLLVNDQQAVDIARAVKKINNLRGPGISNGHDSLTIALPQVAQKPQAATPRGPFLFPVRLETDGGVSGTNKSATCSFTYKVLRYNANILDYDSGDVLAEHVTLTGYGNGLRQLSLELAAATWGWAFYDDNSDLILLFADERPAGEQDCS